MNKLTLITGATDGIGKFTALQLAQDGYSVHILGRDKAKGSKVLETLNKLNPLGNHCLFICDLSKINEVKRFLNSYLKQNNKLDVLILNAGIHPKKLTISEDGIDTTFSVGYISRYLFSAKLNPLLEKSDIKKVIHICGSIVGKISYDKLENPTYSKLKSVWQNSIGSAILVYHWKKLLNTSVTHLHWNPGIVNTQTVKSQSNLIQLLSKYFGMIEPKEAAKKIAAIINSNSNELFYKNGEGYNKIPKKIKSKNELLRLISFSENFTEVYINYKISI
ncbi:SDR family NAD(P)-dependent oxidoreductase [Tenacibaculum aiptasiae]|uniref:SDR family NAD(P)-dependent oxidoreductase n=1 Tax=Tenacibaculum aiptasiae TaxID=426481 RepID=A0A7J5A9U4_9FLAO|nr:SDR family NAD(P)-dependent oxidoreductase [Tenacibaculum aiptasiae]KAB1154198.1 SDR family NAD(P)-dependent oxidoreductase [Tenacibaculum aiptasiae]